ncbi:hypothetical protein SORBI_3009G048800 [Sorghum bicolor]|uniref:Uncharacterized protein n=1 Tax=Sorghum bicolor TaxID=4558 RepID=A0A1Z5R0X4_SORBI|nr:hypothetical protein SORBI_3009G048800 [Sorghum bicolor]
MRPQRLARCPDCCGHVPSAAPAILAVQPLSSPSTPPPRASSGPSSLLHARMGCRTHRVLPHCRRGHGDLFFLEVPPSASQVIDSSPILLLEPALSRSECP